MLGCSNRRLDRAGRQAAFRQRVAARDADKFQRSQRGGGADHADLQYRRDEPSPLRDQRQVAADAHAVVILDGASWHNCHGLVVPSNITLLALPPYSPELNPGERIWHYLRSHWLANSVFRSLADIMDACDMAWNRFATNTGLVRSLCSRCVRPLHSLCLLSEPWSR